MGRRSARGGSNKAGGGGAKKKPGVGTKKWSKGSRPCRAFARGECKHGAACKYSHAGGARGAASAASDSSIADGAKKKRRQGDDEPAAAAAAKMPSAAAAAAATKPAVQQPAVGKDAPQWVGTERIPAPADADEQETRRSCAQIPALRKYLQTAGRSGSSLEYANNAAVWAAIERWARKTDGGIAHLNGCAGLPQSGGQSWNFDVAHVVPKAAGGASCVFNAYFMPSAHAKAFGNAAVGKAGGAKGMWKKAYVGAAQAKFASEVMRIGKEGKKEQWESLEKNLLRTRPPPGERE